MFERLKIWFLGSSGLKEATREATRQAVRDGFTEGLRLGLEDALTSLESNTAQNGSVVHIDQPKDGHGKHNEPLTAAELRTMRKADLLALAEERGIDAEDSWTVAELRENLSVNTVPGQRL